MSLTYQMMPLTSPGLRQRPAMRCYYAVWSRERSKVGQRLKKSIEFAGLMLKDIVVLKVLLKKGQDKPSSGKVTTCVYYNKGSCAHKQTHETKRVQYKHICISCCAKYGKSYPHPQTECRKSAKNE